ncbi:MAG: metallophosphoesterase [bacterium]|nr:metallophosphoesterase [bacterium]
MKIAIISDTHDNLNAITSFGEKLKELKPEYLLHGGDFCSPFTICALKNYGLPMKAVFGNNDGDKVLLTKSAEGFAEIQEGTYIFTFADRNFAMTHYPESVNSLAASEQFDIIIYGHTHKLDIRNNRLNRLNSKSTESCIIINPGELCGWLNRRKTAVLLDTNTLTTEIIEVT